MSKSGLEGFGAMLDWLVPFNDCKFTGSQILLPSNSSPTLDNRLSCSAWSSIPSLCTVVLDLDTLCRVYELSTGGISGTRFGWVGLLGALIRARRHVCKNNPKERPWHGIGR